jgi:hypothetical protein
MVSGSIVLVVVLLGFTAKAMAEKAMLIADTNAKSAYPIGLLKLALSLSGKHYDFAFLPDSPTANHIATVTPVIAPEIQSCLPA